MQWDRTKFEFGGDAMVAKKRNVILINIVIVVASIMASLYYYYCLSNISIPFHSDDAGSTFALMDD